MKNKLYFIILLIALVSAEFLAASFNFSNQTAAVRVNKGSRLVVDSSSAVNSWSGTLQRRGTVAGNSPTFAFDEGIYKDQDTAAMLSGTYNPAEGNGRYITLGGNKKLRVDTGDFTERVYVESNGNNLEGKPLFSNDTTAAPNITLADSAASLTLGIGSQLNGFVQLNGGSITLSNNLMFSDGKGFLGEGVLNFNNKQLAFGGSDYHMSSTLYMNKATDIVLNGNTDVSGIWEFGGAEGRVSGNGNVLDLGSTGTLWVKADTTLYLSNLKLRGLGNGNGAIVFENNTSSIRLHDVEIELSNNYSVTQGNIFVDGKTNVIAKNYKLIFDNKGSMTVDGTAFEYDTLSFSDSDNIVPLTVSGNEANLALLNNAVIRNKEQEFGDELIRHNSNAIAAQGVLVRANSNYLFNSVDERVNSNSNFIHQSLNGRVINNSNAIATLDTQVDGHEVSIRTNSNAIIGLDELTRANSNAVATQDVLVRANSNYLFNSVDERVNSNSNFIFNSLDQRVINNSNTILDLDTRVTANEAAISAIDGSGDITNPAELTKDEYLHKLPGSFQRKIIISSSTVLDGNNNTIRFAGDSGLIDVADGQTLTLQNVLLKGFSPNHVELNNSGVIHFGDNVHIELAPNIADAQNGYMDTSYTMTFVSSNTSGAGNIIIDGCGHELKLNASSGTKDGLSVLGTATLTIQNARLEGVGLGGSNIKCVGRHATLNLKSSELVLSNNFTFTNGYMNFYDDVIVRGREKKFTLASNHVSTIAADTILTLDHDVTFSYDPVVGSKSMLAMGAATSALNFNGSTLHTTHTGLHITQGTVFIDNKVTFSSEARNDAEAIELDAAGMTMKVLSGAMLDVHGRIRIN